MLPEVVTPLDKQSDVQKVGAVPERGQRAAALRACQTQPTQANMADWGEKLSWEG